MGRARYGIGPTCTVAVDAELPERVHVAVTLYVRPEVQTPVQLESTATPDPLAANAGEVAGVVPPTLTRLTVQDAPGRV